jgi:glycosyltransferase involved in cell wall biosynthesis
MTTILSLFGIMPKKIGGQEAFARELSVQLAKHSCHSVLCFADTPPEHVREYLALPNVTLEVLETPQRMVLSVLRNFGVILRRHKPDIVHLHYVGFLSWYPWLARLCGARRVYFTDHTSRPAFHVLRRAPLWKRILTRVINGPLTGVISVSDFGKRCMTALDVLPQDRFHLIYNSVDTSRCGQDLDAAMKFRRKYGIPDRCAVVTQVSWLIQEKGIVDFLEAAALVLKQNPDVHFVLVGDGASREEFANLAMKLGIAEHLTWTGLVQDPLGEGVYAAADVVCQVSRWEEVFGFTIAEAMACGRPVVATQVGGIPELVQDGQTGFLVPRGAPDQIANRILALTNDADLRSRFGQAGRNVAAKLFDLEQNVSQLLGLYGLR